MAIYIDNSDSVETDVLFRGITITPDDIESFLIVCELFLDSYGKLFLFDHNGEFRGKLPEIEKAINFAKTVSGLRPKMRKDYRE